MFRGDDPDDRPRQAYVDDDSPLTAPIRKDPEPEIDFLELVLGAPAWLMELAFTPLSALVLAMDKLKLHERLFDLFTNDDNTFGIFPLYDPFDSTGMGFGAAVVHNDPLGSPDRLVLLGMVRTNLDRTVSASFSRRIPYIGGRAVRLSARYESDADVDYYGLGPDSTLDDRRTLRLDAIEASTGITLLDPAVPEWSVDLDLGLRYRELGTGTGGFPSVVVGGAVAPPPGFGAALLYPEASVAVSYDSRDSKSRTNRGLKLRVEGAFTHDVDGGKTNALRSIGELDVYVPLAALHRVLVLSAGVGGTFAFGDDFDVPLHHMQSLGGSSILRGYRGGRFVDRFAWWGSAQYRWQMFELQDTGDGISSVLFVDVGRVAPSVERIFATPVAWSAGFGLRLETDLFALAQFQLGFSPDGVRVSLKVGEF